MLLIKRSKPIVLLKKYLLFFHFYSNHNFLPSSEYSQLYHILNCSIFDNFYLISDSFWFRWIWFMWLVSVFKWWSHFIVEELSSSLKLHYNLCFIRCHVKHGGFKNLQVYYIYGSIKVCFKVVRIMYSTQILKSD